MQTHETLRHDEVVKTSSDRFFGLLFFFVFLLIGLWLMLNGKPVYPISLGIALVFLAVALIAPKWLAPLNRLWMKFGELLHWIVSPIILSVMFFGIITPVGWLMRLVGRDSLHTKLDRNADSYWIRREPHGPDSVSLKRQF